MNIQRGKPCCSLCASGFDSSYAAQTQKTPPYSGGVFALVTRTGRRLARKVFAENGEAIFRTPFAQTAKVGYMRYEYSKWKVFAASFARVGSMAYGAQAKKALLIVVLFYRW